MGPNEIIVNRAYFGDGWVSVNDRLPDTHVPVLIYDADGGKYPMYVDWTFKSSTGKILWDFGANYDEDGNALPATYSHWMPLPNPPDGP